MCISSLPSCRESKIVSISEGVRTFYDLRFALHLELSACCICVLWHHFRDPELLPTFPRTSDREQSLAGLAQGCHLTLRLYYMQAHTITVRVFMPADNDKSEKWTEE